MVDNLSKTLFAVSTYQKNHALKDLLDSAMANFYLDNHDFLICDDANGYAREVFDEYKLPTLLYTTGVNKGIAINKNRGIKFFLENKQYDNLILLDDDMLFIKKGLVEACEKVEHPHVTGYLGDYRDPLSKKGFFHQFPYKGETPGGIIFCEGSQGVMLFFKREIIEKAMYFHVPPGKYGFEHSIFSNVINRIQGYYIDYFPILKKTPKYIIGNYNHPNQYSVEEQGDWHKDNNQIWWRKMKYDILNGVNYINKNSQVPDGEEVIRNA